MARKIINLIIIVISIATLVALIFIFSSYFNRGVDFLNEKLPFDLPYIPEQFFKLRYDLKGGAWLLYEVNFKKQNEAFVLKGLGYFTESRLAGAGIKDFSVKTKQKHDKYQMAVEVRGEDALSGVAGVIETPPVLEFMEERSSEETEKINEKRNELAGKTEEEIMEIDNWRLALEDPYFKATGLDGSYIEKVMPLFNQNAMKPAIFIEFSEEGAKIFEDLTERNVGKFLAIYADRTMLSSFSISEKITGGGIQISGDFNTKQAEVMAGSLAAVSFLDSLKLVSQEVKLEDKAEHDLANILKAVFFAALFSFLVAIILNRFLGFLGSLSFLIFAVLAVGIVKLLSVDMGAMSILGFVSGLAVYLNCEIIVFSKIKKEIHERKVLSKGLEYGFKKGWVLTRKLFLISLIIILGLPLFNLEFVDDFRMGFAISILCGLCSLFCVCGVFFQYLEQTRKSNWLLK